MTNYHIIGDIHGYADKLEELLDHLGYKKIEGIYQQENAKVVFLGDFIDRGCKQRRVIDIVRPMIDNDYALAVMGNHEFNAICYHTIHPEYGDPLRPHTTKNTDQHQAFLDEYSLNDSETKELIDWFKTLPLYLSINSDVDNQVLFRAIHACWNQAIIERVPQYLDDIHLLAATEKGSQEYADIEILIKGLEMPLPGGVSYLDSSQHERTDIRVKWWSSVNGGTYRDVAMVPESEIEKIPNTPLPAVNDDYIYPKDAPPVFFGHYWMIGEPKIAGKNLACLDYSAGKGGQLVSYEFSSQNSSHHLINNNFIYVDKRNDDQLQDHIIRFLSSLEVQFNKADSTDPDAYMKKNIVICRASDHALSTLESYFRKNNIPCDAPAGPVRAVDKASADHLEQLLGNYREKGWITTVPVSEQELKNIDYEYQLRNIVGHNLIGKTNAGWKIEIQFNRCYSRYLLDLIGTWSPMSDPDKYQFYFREENELNDLMSKISLFSD